MLDKTLEYFTIKSWDYTADKFISINLLKYTATIITYDVVSYMLFRRPSNPKKLYPILINLANNMSENSGTEKVATSNLASRGLSRLFYSLCLDNLRGLNSEFIPGISDTVADAISRVCYSPGSVPNFIRIMQDNPELNF